MIDQPIGGYFGIELPRGGGCLHSGALHLNSGRSALAILLRSRKLAGIHIPHFTCAAVTKVVQNSGIPVHYYRVDKAAEILSLPQIPGADQALLYTNYFGLKDRYIERLASQYPRLIVDNCQAFFSSPLPGVDTFYSPRKFFGVPDGGHLYSSADLDPHGLRETYAFNDCTYLLKRWDISPEAGYSDFLARDSQFDTIGVGAMSRLSRRILESIDYPLARRQRWENFAFLHERLVGSNELAMDFTPESAPLTYPYLREDGQDLRTGLLKRRIYCATYWPDVLNRHPPSTTEHYLAKNLVHLPIDHRYTLEQMDTVLRHLMALK